MNDETVSIKISKPLQQRAKAEAALCGVSMRKWIEDRIKAFLPARSIEPKGKIKP